MDLKVIRKKVLSIVIPLFLIAAVTISLFLAASVGDAVKYANITSEDYDLGSGSYDIIDAAPCVYSGFLPVAQKGNLTMYVNASTTAVAVYDSDTGRTLTSMIPNEEFDTAGSQNADTFSNMRSNFVLTAVNMESGNTSDYNMYDSLSSNGKFKIEGIEDGVRITYLIGKIPETYLLPEALTEKRYNEIKNQLSEEDARSFENRYMLLDISLYYGDEKSEYLEKYPSCTDENIYIINSDKEFILEEVEEVLETINYTEEQKEKDEKEVTADYEEEGYTVFRIPMEFKLNEDNFSVTVDRDNILYGDEALPVYIDVCPYLVRAYSNESGYMLLPDGSGSIMNLNNGRTTVDSYLTQIYGEDPLFYDNFSRVLDESAQLPVCGLKSDKGGIFAYISEGAEDAFVKAGVSGKTSSTNNANIRFKLFGYKKEMVAQDWTVTGNGTIYNVRIQGEKIIGKCTTEFYFMPADKCEYSDMAELCRDIMRKDGVLKEQQDVNTNAALINLLGAYDYKKSILGIPVTANKVMTTAEEAEKIVSEIEEMGITADARYLSAVNGGFKQSVADGISLVWGIGSKKDYKSLSSAVEKIGGRLYTELSFTSVYHNKLFDSFSVSNDSVAQINTKHSAFFEWDPISFYYVNRPHYYLAPANFEANMKKVLKDAEKLGINGIAFRSIGDTLYSDADEDNYSSRVTVSQEFSKAADAATEAGISGLYNGGGAYILKNASYLADIPSESSGYAVTDESVPFLQMVIHGSVAYTYEPVFNAADTKKLMLNSIATGAKLQFNVSAKNSYELKTTDYSEFYNTCWEDNAAEIEKCCEFMREAIEETAGREFISFEYINDYVTKSVFSDGVELYVNYSENDCSVGEIMIEAQNYTLVK